MQHFKTKYKDTNFRDTFSNIQKCLRLNDWEEIGDGTHFLIFEMIGLFSFREWSLQQSIDFMYGFLSKLNIKPDYVTMHKDKYEEWKSLYSKYEIEIRIDNECVWSDGDIGGYCTEFYKDDIEIGNIVNTLGNCIDIGFGLERLLTVTNNIKSKTKLEILEDTVISLIDSGVKVGNNKSSYILKKLITESVLLGSERTEDDFKKMRDKIRTSYILYQKNKKKSKYKDKDSSFWLDTFGIDENRITDYESIINKLDY